MTKNKLNEEMIEFILQKRLTSKNTPSYKQLSEDLFKEYGVKITPQGLAKMFNKVKDDYIISKIKKHLKTKPYNQIYLTLTNQPDFQFEGYLAKTKKTDNITLNIYFTKGLNLVLQKKDGNQSKAIHALLIQDMLDFFGWSETAKSLYEDIGLKRYIEID